jgi:hypothetical protein
MCFFRKRRLRKKAEKLAKQKKLDYQNPKVEERNDPKPQQVSSNETVETLKVRPYTKPKESVEPPKPIPNIKKEQPVKKSSQKSTNKKPTGKYEIYPEGNYFKFRLKASNGEILCVSFRYSSEKGARTGIDTFIKNVDDGNFEVVTDKSHYSQFYLYNKTGARFIIIGEVYKDVKQAHSAVESVKNFYKTDRIDVLEEIPVSEIREEDIQFEKVDQVDTGKYEIYENNQLFYIRLIASNGQVMLNSQGYASKTSAKSGLDTIKNAIKDKNFTLSWDKQNRYQFNLYSSRGQLILAGETYPVKSSGVSAAHSVLKFGLKATVVEK